MTRYSSTSPMRHRRAWLALALLAMALRAAFPAGWMPAAAAPGGAGLTLIICTTDGFATLHVPADPADPAPPEPGDHCTFAAPSADAASVPPALPLPARFDVAISADAPRPGAPRPAPRGPPLPPRGPPALS